METTRPKQGKLVKGIFVLSLAALFMGGLIGIGVSLVSKIVYLVFVSPLVMGGVGGGAIAKLLAQYKIRIPAVGLIFGIMIGLVSYGVYHYAEYISFKAEAVDYIEQQLVEMYGESDHEIAQQVVDARLLDLTGQQGFPGYLIVTANEGISIGHIFRNSSLHLGKTLTYIYWVFELALVVATAANMGWRAASKRYCEFCDTPLGTFDHIGAADISRAFEVTKYLKQHDFRQLGNLLSEDAELPSVDVYMRGCTNCQKSPSEVVVKQVSYDRRGEVQLAQVYETTISPTQRRELLNQLVWMN